MATKDNTDKPVKKTRKKTAKTKTIQHCDFCGKSAEEVDKIIASDDGHTICNECVKLCGDIILDSEADEDTGEDIEIAKPHEIKKFLDQYIIGQEDAKKKVAVAVYNHYKRNIFNNNMSKDDIPIQKSNIIMLGESGCGKTAIWKAIAKMMKVPFVIADATSLTSAGYIGQDVESILVSAIKAADYDISLAQKAICVIDEADKLRKQVASTSTGKDVAGEAVQQALLKMIEGADIEVNPSGKRAMHSETVTINTNNILFVFNGHFAGLDKIVQNRMAKKEIGFGQEEKEYTPAEYLKHVIPTDLINYGMIAELVGRSPVIIPLDTLTEDNLVDILVKPKDAIIKQYEELFNMDNVKLDFKKDALRAIANIAIEQKTSARGLRGTVEALLGPIMYDYPMHDDIKEIIITKDLVNGLKNK